MYMPTVYTDPVTEYWNLVNDVTIWDVACQRQIEISGPDAFDFVQYLTPRDMSKGDVGQCQYLVLTDEDGGIINDAVTLRLEERRFWLSPADGDALLWISGVAVNSGMSVKIIEPDVSPLQLQGPKSPQLARVLLGDWAVQLKYYWLKETSLDGIPLVVARTGWSGELGYELFLQDSEQGGRLWERVMQAGTAFNIAPIAPSTIRSVEGRLLSYMSDIRRADNPYVLGMDRLVELDQPGDFIGRKALEKIKAEGASRRLVGVELQGPAFEEPNQEFWPVLDGDEPVGHITRCVYSPRLERNIGFANVPIDHATTGTNLVVATPFGDRPATVCYSPWFPAQTSIPKVA
jgi:aminomethyltransferase